jgi:hypothetical protein
MPAEIVPQAPTAPGHTAYSSLVEGEDDLVGLIAYSLYKSDKLAFLNKHRQDTNTAPTEQELMAFCRTCTLPGPVSDYRAKATYLLQEMYDTLMEDAVQELEEKYKNKLITELKHAHPFMTGVWQHFLAGLLIWAVLGFTILVLYGHKIGYKDLARDFLGLDAPTVEATVKPGNPP